MNSKLRDILNNLVNRTYGLHSVQIKEVPRAEKAIRQAVGEEMLEIVDSPSATLVGSDGAWIKQAELRQKIKDWSEADTQEQSNIKESE